MKRDTTFKYIFKYRGSFDGTEAGGFTIYNIEPVRQSDTMDFSPNDSWREFEPKTDIPRQVAVVTVETSKPFDHIAKGVTVGSCAVIWVMLPFIFWLKLFGRG